MDLASSSRVGSTASKSSGSTATTLAVCSSAFSSRAMPRVTGVCSSRKAPTSGSRARRPGRPSLWTCAAPSRLPRPMVSIFSRPLS